MPTDPQLPALRDLKNSVSNTPGRKPRTRYDGSNTFIHFDAIGAAATEVGGHVLV